MTLTAFVDADIRPGVDPAQVRGDISRWLSTDGAELTNGPIGPWRVQWAERVDQSLAWDARLIASHSRDRMEVRLFIRIEECRGRVRLERTSWAAPGAKVEPLAPPPSFLNGWLPVVDDSAPIESIDDPRLGSSVVLLALNPNEDDVSSTRRLKDTLHQFCIGLSPVFCAAGDVLEAVCRGGRLSSDGRPGSLVAIHDGLPGSELAFVPATVAMRTPEAAARRISQFLLSHVDLTLPAAWQDLNEWLSKGALDEDVLLGVMEQDLAEWEEARKEFRLRIQELETERTDLIVDRAADAEQIDRLQSQVRSLQKALSAAAVYVVPEAAEDDLDLYPDSCVEAVTLARELLRYLNVSASLDRAAALDASDRSLDWAKRVWTLLRGLNDYARYVSSGELRAGLADYCRNPPLGAFQLNWSKVALHESEATEGNPSCRRARLFPVPQAVNPLGEEVMFPHLKVDNFPPAPRVHFLDTASEIGQVVVGYVGPHLPTAG